MNIFTTDKCPVKSAQALPDQLTNKMLLEAVQVLSTVHFSLDGKQVAYKPTHSRHPVMLWAASSKGNYRWLYEHYKALCNEYTFRTGKVHKSSDWLSVLTKAPAAISDAPLSEFVLCDPDEFRMKSLTCIHGAYKLYLKSKWQSWTTRTDKRQMQVKWTNRNKPEWA